MLNEVLLRAKTFIIYLVRNTFLHFKISRL